MVIQGRFLDGLLVAFAAIAINIGMTVEATTTINSSSANSPSASTSASLGPDCYDPWISDAVCNLRNNKAACGYDGGDCCECTCVDTKSNGTACGEEGFACIDPEAPCAEDDDVTSVYTSWWSTYNATFGGGSYGCIDSFIGDGDCDSTNNEAGCQYDGGDCCSCTCVDAEFLCDDNGGFACVDPNAPCVDDDDYTSAYNFSSWSFVNATTGCIDSYIGDGFCDSTNNRVDCQFDGGDCCSCTCVDAEFRCDDYGGFACVDPNAPCVDDDDYTSAYNFFSWWFVNATTGCIDSYIGDGVCDLTNNRADCQFDGGDCCSCTCVDTEFLCGDNGGFACVDPSAPCVDDDDYTSAYNFSSWSFVNATTGCIDSFISDGFCDLTNNHAGCQFDGGDCCSCTCVDAEFRCDDYGGSACVDPNAPCVDDDNYTSAYNLSSSWFVNATTGCIDSYIGDGFCDPTNNQADCQFDGGDCCSCTCVDGPYHCGKSGYNCEDPAVSCVEEDGYNMCVLFSSGDGKCDEMNNHEECDYDGGDCCGSSCEDAEFTCGLNGYNCLDPAMAVADSYSPSPSPIGMSSSAEQHLPTCVLTAFIGAIGVLVHALG